MKKLWFFLILVLLWACGSSKKVVKKGVEIKEVKTSNWRLIEKRKIKGKFLGANFDKMELYLEEELNREKRTHKIVIFDLKKMELSRSFQVPVGGFEDPDKMVEPFYMEYTDGRYFLVDLDTKIFVYNEELNFLFPVMLYEKRRFFLDFFKKGENYFFFIGRNKFTGKINEISGEVYKIISNRKPRLVKKIVKFYAKDDYYKDRGKKIYKPVLWVTPFGFEKEGKLYYFYGEKGEYRYYDIDSERETVVYLGYLNCRKYSREEAEKLARWGATSTKYTRWLLSHGFKFVIEPYPLPVCFFTIYDAGKGKIGIITEVDIDKKKYRMDIFLSEKGKYIESLWLPFGKVFVQSTGTYHGQLPYRNSINLDKGIYIFQDWDDELEIFTTKIIKFEQKK